MTGRSWRSHDTRRRTAVTVSFASLTRWKWSTLTRALGSSRRTADRNAAEGSIATTSTRRRHHLGCASSQVRTAAESRPSTRSMTFPLLRSTRQVIHGSTRRHRPGPPAGSSGARNQRTLRNRCSSIPSRRTSRGLACRCAARTIIAAVSCRITVGHDTPNCAATRCTGRASPATASTNACLSRVVILARGGT